MNKNSNFTLKTIMLLFLLFCFTGYYTAIAQNTRDRSTKSLSIAESFAILKERVQEAKKRKKSGISSNNSSNQSNAYSQSNQSQSSNNSNMEWREELEFGMFAINSGNPNGFHTRTIWRTCSACMGSTYCNVCHGNIVCNYCNGNGYIITAGYGNYLFCAGCGGTGKCGVCHGTGKCVCNNFKYPGYMPGSTITIGANGQVIYDSGSYSSGTSSSSSPSLPSSSSKGTCSVCHGTGVNPSPASGGDLSSWKAHTNTEGIQCIYCGRYSWHQHLRCYNCNVPTR